MSRRISQFLLPNVLTRSKLSKTRCVYILLVPCCWSLANTVSSNGPLELLFAMNMHTCPAHDQWHENRRIKSEVETWEVICDVTWTNFLFFLRRDLCLSNFTFWISVKGKSQNFRGEHTNVCGKYSARTFWDMFWGDCTNCQSYHLSW